MVIKAMQISTMNGFFFILMMEIFLFSSNLFYFYNKNFEVVFKSDLEK